VLLDVVGRHTNSIKQSTSIDELSFEAYSWAVLTIKCTHVGPLITGFTEQQHQSRYSLAKTLLDIIL